MGAPVSMTNAIVCDLTCIAEKAIRLRDEFDLCWIESHQLRTSGVRRYGTVCKHDLAQRPRCLLESSVSFHGNDAVGNHGMNRYGPCTD
jgi:hypothetical protein